MNRDILISGASIAGPVLAYWLREYGFRPVVVERAPALRAGLGGHAVDLFGPAVDIAAWMGILPQIQAAKTETRTLALERPGRPVVHLDAERLAQVLADKSVEVLRGYLARILHESTHGVEYLFGDEITALHESSSGVDVTFASGATRRFDLVIGADGLRSGVRRLAFGDQAGSLHFLNRCFGVYSVPAELSEPGTARAYQVPGRIVACYPVRGTDEARAVFLFYREQEPAYDHRDVAAQKALLREEYARDGWEVPRMLSHLEAADDFYFDSISQVRLPHWTRGRAALVGDAGYSPGAAVGGGTSLAVVSAYVLAGELAAAGGDHTKAFPAYENEIRPMVEASWKAGQSATRNLVPKSDLQIAVNVHAGRFLQRLPVRLLRALLSRSAGHAKAFNAITPKRYDQELRAKGPGLRR